MWVAGKSRDPEGPPAAPGAAFGDTGASLHAFGAVSAALYRREKDGKGEYIDIALLDALFDQIDSAIEIHVMSKGKDDSALLSSVLSGKNGYATIAFGTSDAEWEKLAHVMGRSELLEDERFSHIKHRIKHIDAIYQYVEEWLHGFEDIDDALTLLEKAGIVNARILSVAEALEHPQIKARNMMVEIDHPALGKIPVVNSPFRLKNSEAGLAGLPPELGEHNEEILTRYAGYPVEDIKNLEQDGVLYRKQS
jgi:CoA:oxalate CoA-transferase